MAQQELTHLLKKKLPNQPDGSIEQAAKNFLQHLRERSPIIAENFSAGRMGEEDLNSRLDIFLGDHPEYSGRAPRTDSVDPRQVVADMLKAAPDLAHSDDERRALVDRFVERLGGLSGTARRDLLAGRLPRDELLSRVTVFLNDLRAEAARASADPAVAAAAPVADAYIAANFGSAADRVDSICLRGTAEEGATKHEFVLFKMRPNLLRIHMMQNGMVVGVLGFDGTTAWAQLAGKPPVPALGRMAEVLSRTSRFDDPLVAYRERGAVVRLEGKQADGEIKLSIHETDGTDMVSSIDPATYNQLSLRTHQPGAHWFETRFRDYRKVGAVNIPFLQEEYEEGVLTSTTRYSEATIDPGLIARFFAHPTVMAFDYMDFMGGLAVMEARERKEATAAPQIKITK